MPCAFRGLRVAVQIAQREGLQPPELRRGLAHFGRLAEGRQRLLVVVREEPRPAQRFPRQGACGCHLHGVSSAVHSFWGAVQVAQSHGLQQPELRRGLTHFGRLAERAKGLLVIPGVTHSAAKFLPGLGTLGCHLDGVPCAFRGLRVAVQIA